MTKENLSHFLNYDYYFHEIVLIKFFLDIKSDIKSNGGKLSPFFIKQF